MEEERSSPEQHSWVSSRARERLRLAFFIGVAFCAGVATTVASGSVVSNGRAFVQDVLERFWNGEGVSGEVIEVSKRSSRTISNAPERSVPTPAPAKTLSRPRSTTAQQVISENSRITQSPVVVPSAVSENSRADQPRECTAAFGVDPNHQVLINEVAWMGSVGDANAEWIELLNNAGVAVSLAGWQLRTESGKISLTFSSDTHLSFSGYALLERTDDESVPGVQADAVYTGALANTGERIQLFDHRCVLVDELDARSGWPGGESAARKTLERNVRDFGWHTSTNANGTPKRENASVVIALRTVAADPALSQPASDSSAPPPTDAQSSPPATQTPNVSVVSHALIVAVQITGGVGKANNDFIKIHNPSGASLDVGDWKLRKRTQSGTESSIRVFPSGTSIPAGGYITWANSDGDFATIMNAELSSTQTLSANNSIALIDAAGAAVDALAWGEGHTAPFVEGSAYPTSPDAGQVLQRRQQESGAQDTDQNAQDFFL